MSAEVPVLIFSIFPDPPTLAFLEKARAFPKNARVSLLAETLKSLEKEGKTQEKARKIGKRKKQGNRKRQGLEGQGLFFLKCRFGCLGTGFGVLSAGFAVSSAGFAEKKDTRKGSPHCASNKTKVWTNALKVVQKFLNNCPQTGMGSWILSRGLGATSIKKKLSESTSHSRNNSRVAIQKGRQRGTAKKIVINYHDMSQNVEGHFTMIYDVYDALCVGKCCKMS